MKMIIFYLKEESDHEIISEIEITKLAEWVVRLFGVNEKIIESV